MYLPLHSEQQLLEGLAKGDRSTTEQVYKSHYKVIASWIQTHGGGSSDSADVFQEAMAPAMDTTTAMPADTTGMSVDTTTTN